MAITKLKIEEFLNLSRQYPVLDVRSPGEYLHAHIPGAHSLPLFSDEERKQVGTAYKQQSREVAIKLGLDYFGPKMRSMVEEVETLTKDLPSATANSILVHCWRGGMRSAGVAWLLDLYGFKVYTLIGGYKAYRQWTLEQLSKPYDLKILGGYTGSGKTLVLHELKKQGEAVVDLEALAHHKGSAFGDLGEQPQPSPEMFENKLAIELAGIPENKTIWLEDESQRIGHINIPHAFWQTMRKAPVHFLDIPFEERLRHIVEGYSGYPKEKLVNAIIRIKKRLGGQDTKNAINFLLDHDHKQAFSILLKYYDKYYLKGLYNREHADELIQKIACEKVDAIANTLKLVNNKQVV